MITYAVEGLDGMYANLKRIDAATAPEKVKEFSWPAATLVRDRAKSLAPYDPRRKKGWHLRQAIFAAPGNPSDPNILVGVSMRRKFAHFGKDSLSLSSGMVKGAKPSAPHAILVEFGTKRSQAQPYMRPAVAQTKDQVRVVIVEGFGKAIQSALR